MATYRLDEFISVPALTSYTVALLALARDYAASLAPIPTIASDLQSLEDATAATIAADAAWEARTSELDAALSRHEAALDQALKSYRPIRDWLPVIIRKAPDGAVIKRILSRCKSPGALKVGATAAAMERLASGMEDYPAQFASVGLGAADVAPLRAAKDALVAASDALSRAERERNIASDRRDKARKDLIPAAQLIEDYLKRRGGSDAIVGMKRLRISHLPLKSRGSAETAEPEPAEE